MKCNTNWEERKNTKIDLVGFFDKDYARVKLGDTLTFSVQIPDSLLVRNLKDSTAELVSIQSLQEAPMRFSINKIDTIAGKHNFCVKNDISVILADKIISYSCTAAPTNTSIKPFKCVIKIVPLTKGIFYFETEKFMNNNFRFNGNSAGISTLSIGNDKKNWELLMPYLPDYVNSTTRTTDFYAFKVE
jgi:hypothetical protein